MTRRQWLLQTAITAGSASLLPAAHAAPPSKLGNKLRIVIPANAGGGWDQTGRALGAALVSSGMTSEVVYENIGGKGGTIGLEQYVKRYADQPDTLLIGGMVMVGAIALNKPAVNLTQVQPLARLTSDYLVAAVPADSPFKTAKDLTEAMRKDLRSVVIAGGSAGGVDHMFAGLLVKAAKAAPEQLQYKPFPGGNDVVQALLQRQVPIGISGFSEFSSELSNGKLRAIGISSRRAGFGIPSFRDQGVDAEMANWRAVFTGKNIPAQRQQQLSAAIEYAVSQESWKNSLQANHWIASWQSGKAFVDFLEIETATAQLITYLLKLKA